MPRNGSGVYSSPTGTHGAANTTIASAPYNANVDDVAQDLNVPRPIVAGGTGATTAAQALTNLGGELALQLVDNFDSFAFKPGSWWAGGGTPGAPPPTSAGYYGSAVIYGNPGWIQLRAVRTDTGEISVRTQINGTWGGWTLQQDVNAKVNRAGDTITGQLNISGASLVGTGPANNWAAVLNGANITGQSLGLAVQGGTNGSDWALQVNNAAANVNYFSIRGDGDTRFYKSTTFLNDVATTTHLIASAAAGNWPIIINGYPTAGQSFGLLVNAGTNNSDFAALIRNANNSNLFSINGSGLVTIYNSGITSAGTITVQGGGMDITGKTVVHGNNVGDWAAQVIAPGYGLLVQAGTSTSDYGFLVNNAAGSSVLFSVKGNGDAAVASNLNVGVNLLVGGQGYKPGGGAWADSSDQRIKTVTGDYQHGLDQILVLMPKRFTYNGNDTRDPPANTRSDKSPAPMAGERALPVPPNYPYENSPHYVAAVAGTEFIGLIAQEVELTMPELVDTHAGYIDGAAVDDIRSIDSTPLIYALVNAVKALAARIEALEHAQANPR